MKKFIAYFTLIGVFCVCLFTTQTNAAVSKCSYYIDSSYGYKAGTQADRDLATSDTDGSQTPYLLEKGYRLSFWGGSMTQNCIIDLTHVTVNGGSITGNGPGQSITVIGDGDDVFDGRIYMEAGNYVFKNIKFKRTQATTEDSGITININEYNGSGGSSYYFDENTEIITGDYIPAAGHAREALEISGLQANSQVVFDGKIKMESGGVGVVLYSPSKNSNILDNSKVIFNGQLEMGPTSIAGFYQYGKTSNLVLSEKSNIINTLSDAPVFTMQTNTVMNSMNLLGSIQSDLIMSEGQYSTGSINTLNFGGSIKASSSNATDLVAIYSDQIDIENLNFLDTFSITSDYKYLVNKSSTKGNSTIKNIVFSELAKVESDSVIYVGNGLIENIEYNGNKGVSNVLTLDKDAHVGIVKLDNMSYTNNQAIIIHNEGIIDNLKIGQNSASNKFIVKRLIVNDGVSALIKQSEISALVITDPEIFGLSTSRNLSAYTIENSDLSKDKIENFNLKNTFLFGPTKQVNDSSTTYQQVQPSTIDVNINKQEAGYMTINAKAQGVLSNADLEYVVFNEEYNIVSKEFSDSETVTFPVQANKKYYVVNYSKVDKVNTTIYSSIASSEFIGLPEYTVNFDIATNGGEGEAPISKTLIEGQKISKPIDPTKIGSTFNGWTIDYKGIEPKWDFNNNVMPSKNITLYAQFTENNYNIIFDSNGGSGRMDKETYTYKETKELYINKFVRNGYNFMGWSTTKNGKVEYKNQIKYLYNKANDVTLYAVWQPASNPVDPNSPKNDLPNTGSSNNILLIGFVLSLTGTFVLLKRRKLNS